MRGKVTVRVLDANGNIKRRGPGLLRRIINIHGKEMVSISHNIITDQGDALLADWLSLAPVKFTTILMNVGTGWTGISPKSNTGCNNISGSRMTMDSGYPQTKGFFGNSDDNVLVYKSTFPIGELNESGVNEAALMNAMFGGQCLAYAQIIPEVNMTVNDSLTVEWEVTFLGS